MWDIDKQCNPDQTPQNSASGLGLYGLITECSIKTESKMKNATTLKTETGGPIIIRSDKMG